LLLLTVPPRSPRGQSQCSTAASRKNAEVAGVTWIKASIDVQNIPAVVALVVANNAEFKFPTIRYNTF